MKDIKKEVGDMKRNFQDKFTEFPPAGADRGTLKIQIVFGMGGKTSLFKFHQTKKSRLFDRDFEVFS